jgi:hypothetical protein
MEIKTQEELGLDIDMYVNEKTHAVKVSKTSYDILMKQTCNVKVGDYYFHSTNYNLLLYSSAKQPAMPVATKDNQKVTHFGTIIDIDNNIIVRDGPGMIINDERDKKHPLESYKYKEDDEFNYYFIDSNYNYVGKQIEALFDSTYMCFSLLSLIQWMICTPLTQIPTFFKLRKDYMQYSYFSYQNTYEHGNTVIEMKCYKSFEDLCTHAPSLLYQLIESTKLLPNTGDRADLYQKIVKVLTTYNYSTRFVSKATYNELTDENNTVYQKNMDDNREKYVIRNGAIHLTERAEVPTETWTDKAAMISKFCQKYKNDIAAAGGVIMGSASTFMIQYPNGPKSTPNDIDIWIPNIRANKIELLKAFRTSGWSEKIAYSPRGKSISPNIRHTYIFTSKDYDFEIQIICIDIPFTEMSEQFDLTCIKSIWNPAMKSDDQRYNFDFTTPNTITDINANCGTYLERPWDLTIEDGTTILTKRAVSRIRKYLSKGFDIKIDAKSRFTIDSVREQIIAMDIYDTNKEFSGFYIIDVEEYDKSYQEVFKMIMDKKPDNDDKNRADLSHVVRKLLFVITNELPVYENRVRITKIKEIQQPTSSNIRAAAIFNFE